MPRRGLRAWRERAKIFFGNLEEGEKDGHFGAHEGGGKRLLTEGRESGMGNGEEKTEEDSTQRTQREPRTQKSELTGLFTLQKAAGVVNDSPAATERIKTQAAS